MSELKEEDVEWVINEMGELGVKINNQFFFMYKGRSYQAVEKYRSIGKREFGECCHSNDYYKEYVPISGYEASKGNHLTYYDWETGHPILGYFSDEWKDL